MGPRATGSDKPGSDKPGPGGPGSKAPGSAVPGSKTYAQYCPAALALDLVGDRWSLLIVRELGIRPARYSDLLRSLPGIATNLLAARLATLSAAGVVSSDPGGGGRYTLTDWGRELFAIVLDLGRWGSRLLLAGRGDRVFQGHYLVTLVLGLFGTVPRSARSPRVSLLLAVDDEPVRVELGPDGVEAFVDQSRRPADVTVEADLDTVLGVLVGAIPPAAPLVIQRRLGRWTAAVKRPGTPPPPR